MSHPYPSVLRRIDLLDDAARERCLRAIHDRRVTTRAAGEIIGAWLSTKPSSSTVHRWRRRHDNGEIDIPVPRPRSVPEADTLVQLQIASKLDTRREGSLGTATTRYVLGEDRSDIDLPATMAYVREQAKLRHSIPRPVTADDRVGVVVLGHLQLGKVGALGGTPEALARIADIKSQLLAHLHSRDLKRVLVVDAGDIVEVVESAGGDGLERNELSPMQQVDAAMTIALELVIDIHDHVAPVTYAAVPSSHSAFRRVGATYGNPALDDWGIVVAQRVAHTARLLDLDVAVVTPDAQLREEALTVEIFGEKLAVVHAHQTARQERVERLAAGHALNAGALSGAALAITGRYHHLRLEPLGRTASGRQGWWVQAPTLDNGSSWFTNTRGDVSDPGLVYLEMTPAGVSIDSLQFFQSAREVSGPRPQMHVVI
ncbi:hypothetical protein [Microbacterium sp. Cr-K29]|uniref:hypothetical protein n=1 Tax=Microbacterium sp. Cr-K29 TaxID=1452534 RepID=UPI0004934521|nr:hypothetical protein [Microbacterium sp. Cr-K29]